MHVARGGLEIGLGRHIIGMVLTPASWGLLRILGENHGTAGNATVDAFVTDMIQSRVGHLRALVGADTGLKRAIQQDWADFARRYIGKDYRNNDYDGKMSRAHESLASRPPARAAR